MSPRGPGIEVTVVFALPDGTTDIALRLPAGATLADALERSGLAIRHPNLDLSRAAVGIFGKRSDRATALADGDRVEVYRPLIVDPKKARRTRVSASAKPRKKLGSDL
jgi:hypothetical protein